MSNPHSMPVREALKYAADRGLTVKRQVLYDAISVHKTIESNLEDGTIHVLTASFDEWLKGLKMRRDLRAWLEKRREVLSQRACA